MSSKDTGGQAFPCFERGSAGVGPLDLTDPGMTLRDYFAGQALAGRLADSSTPFDIFAARYAYRIADIMLEARGE